MILSTNMLNERCEIEEACNSLFVQSLWLDLHSPDWSTMMRAKNKIFGAMMVCPREQRGEWNLLDGLADRVMLDFHLEAA